jgi:mannonate dehydratase
VTNEDLTKNLLRFLEEVIPAAERAGIRLAIHPDDPPFPVLGLPRIVSTAPHLDVIFQKIPSSTNGLCFCTGSFGARPDNDLPAMVNRFATRIHAVHLRSTQLLEDGTFFEAGHLGGSVNMPAVVNNLLREQDRRKKEGRKDWQLTFRPDHGHTMMDDLAKPVGITPGYSCIGRMKGLSELRGLMRGLMASKHL